MTYTVNRVPEAAFASELSVRGAGVWEKAETAQISLFPWEPDAAVSHGLPRAAARMLYTESAFHVRFDTEEAYILARYTEPNSPVNLDSCVEIFFQPAPRLSPKYINLEVNALGALYAAHRLNRAEKDMVAGDRHRMILTRPGLDGPRWTVELTLPFALIRELYGLDAMPFQPGHAMRGNFYKCGDETPRPHFACWNPVAGEVPDFHRPQDFGEIRLGGDA